MNPPSTISPSAIDTHGNLPPFREESAVFFANLLGLFFGNEGKTELLNKAVSGIDSYGGRLVPIINLLFRGSQNLLVLEREPMEKLCNYFQDTLGLSVPEMRSIPHHDYLAIEEALKNEDSDKAQAILGDIATGIALVDGFVTDTALEQIANHLGKKTMSSARGSERGNNKYLLHKHLESCGQPVFLTEEATSRSDIGACLKQLASSGYPNAVLKSAVGASGIGIMKLSTSATDEQIANIPDALFDDDVCMVQGWMERGVHGIARVRSPSVQLFLDDKNVYLYDVTEQILGSESVHEGNESPPPYLGQLGWLKGELFSQAEVAGLWLHAQGYRGTASVDFLVAYFEQRRDPEIRICEINARVTGATYPAILAHHFIPNGAWLMRNLTFKSPIAPDQLIKLIDQGGHLYRPDGEDAGVLPINFIADENNDVIKGQFLCLADLPERCHPLFNGVRQDLPVEWDYTRD